MTNQERLTTNEALAESIQKAIDVLSQAGFPKEDFHYAMDVFAQVYDQYPGLAPNGTTLKHFFEKTSEGTVRFKERSNTLRP